MSDPLPTDTPPALDVAALEPDRDAKIERLLLLGLDHYFSARYEQAINVWTRVLFIDRSHARARAYIERARGALAERQRESEELLQMGMAAFDRGDAGEARRLLQTAIGRGAPSEEALAVIDRLDRLDQGPPPPHQPSAVRAERTHMLPRQPVVRPSSTAAGWLLAIVLAGIAAAVTVVAVRPDWRMRLFLEAAPAQISLAPVAAEPQLPLPRRGENALARARALQATGHLRDALAALDLVRPTDPQKADADRLRATIQQQLIGMMTPAALRSNRERADTHLP